MAFVIKPLKTFTAEPQGQDNKKLYLYQIDPMLIEEEDGFNLRYYEDLRVVAHIEAFCASYMEGRYVPPMVVRALDDGRIVVIEGHCRRRAIRQALERGAHIPLVSVIPFQGNDAERVELMLRSAQGLKLETLDIARGYLRLLGMGFAPADIAASQSKTVARVEQLLALARADDDVQGLVRSGLVSPDAAIEAVQAHGENAAEELTRKLDTARREGRQRVAKTTGRAPAVPRKTVEAVFAQVEAAIARVPAELRDHAAALNTLPSDQRAATRVEVEAEVLVGLILAANEIEAMKVKLAKKLARREGKLAEARG
ncbi:ParB/RepB/Spo0J family partition protein [Acidocella aromatica]|uniref:ParB/Sulfiredoxin domain-containing protein n=1 Tax=Acidocella aromatica TaxID=1303579 RepID=A0A840VDW9_9PROT|nr:ParB/Srx family N-terminal domain-containing protein [Acidocella aromatica]MBB5374053.1 hypothetical protein [Acidocella aromatica]